MKNIAALHSLWSKPFFYSKKYTKFSMPVCEALTMMLSALTWKEKNGPIILYADKFAKKFVIETALYKIYDEIKTLKVDKNIKPNTFWAAGKLSALKCEKRKAAVLDTDMIVWQDIRKQLSDFEIYAMHTEEILKQTYPEKNFFKMKNSYEFDEDWDWNILPLNTSFLYISDMKFKKYYLKKAFEFMKNADAENDTLRYMVFAEQRLLSMCAEKKGLDIKTFLKFPESIGNQKIFTHLWGYKQILSASPELRESFKERLIRRILNDFPDTKNIVKKTIELSI